ncbi:unnamed protein product [Heterobilharzia americana]|nr:unnamed protein product [Heterobilharzia americana]
MMNNKEKMKFSEYSYSNIQNPHKEHPCGDYEHVYKIPPCHLLPPYPPIIFDNLKISPTINKTLHLPKINSDKQNYSQKDRNVKKSVHRKVICCKELNEKINISTNGSYNEVQYKNFICRLCGIDCIHSALLYAHLLIIEHRSRMLTNKLNNKNIVNDSSQYDNLYFICRRCGKQWIIKKFYQNINQHGCIQQKVIHLTLSLLPKGSLQYGLPFICLLCCSPDNMIENNRKLMLTNSRNTPHSLKSPLKLYQTCIRFWSKLHLVVHILCRHAVGRKPGKCAECNSFNQPYSDDYKDESQFWRWKKNSQRQSSKYCKTQISSCSNSKECKTNYQDYSSEESSTSESDENYRCKSSNPLLFPEGLHNLETHIDAYHLPQIEIAFWLKHQSIKGDNTEYNWIYSCPLCQLISISYDLSTQHENRLSDQLTNRITSNAMLQAHIVCFHAGANQIDSLLGICQVCSLNKQISESITFIDVKTNYTKSSIHFNKHLIHAKHIHRLNENYELAVKDGRIQENGSSLWELDLSTTCIICWQRFLIKSNDPLNCLYAQCRLQAHLLVSHCTYMDKRNIGYSTGRMHAFTEYIQPCGWCGKTYDNDLQNSMFKIYYAYQVIFYHFIDQ